ncbi:UDP-N-acetylmuramoylalanyl-D-glutamyl-2,6- diaminopimelate--D-alanyl-D-alanine ligase [Anaerovibrio sp. JC8]|uniref:UDP-N-acetylmuramoyl-tripeptide--D-alanyl-D- alanine ligase n=1 Tax=Anaerovibrio sp. JC8 TaxID=1240085 RepID=UPI000A0CB49D|nr:UDP-N-acetylmuramoyl-tripeptide--D-alanyl-D-alanine ligase [Anaerovibrio sp. JC8]ORU01353.1 UDP-N-acetylmuramoylalanyl-D-glutamyl-2,6- diaminopimelate--D-alanyl-D-alanine ligase [Anaerovibrio sp. JC8]
MPEFSLADIESALDGAKILEKGQQNFTDIITDTRKIQPGCLFVALKGERFNGETFAEEALKLGANGVLVSNEYQLPKAELGGTVIQAASDTQTAYQQLAHFWRMKFDIPVVCITGSNGKTTTKDLTASVLSAKFPVLKTQANYNNEVGLPMTLLNMNESHKAAVVEIGMRGLGQIKALAPIAAPTIGIVTNVGETHMELLGSMENIAKAKAELVEAIPTGGTVILNNDNKYTAAMKDKCNSGVRVITFGIDNEADIKAFDVEGGLNSTTFKCRLGMSGDVGEFVLPMVGRHNVSNALAAVAAGFALGLDANEIQRGLDGLEMTGMRFEAKRVGQYNVINDAYNASPMSMEAAINTLAEITKGRRIAVLGDMLELGEVSVAAHQKVGQQVAESGAVALVAFGTMGKEIAKGAQAAGMENVFHVDSHEAAAIKLKELLQPEDTVLFKGSRGMKMEAIIDLI